MSTTEKNIELLRAEMARLLALPGRAPAATKRAMTASFACLVDAASIDQDVGFWTSKTVAYIGSYAKRLGVPVQIKLQNDGAVVNM